MEDIEVLEKMIEGFKKADIPQYKKEDLWTYCKYKQYQAIENILKERQADKERIKELEQRLDEISQINFPTMY